MVCGAEVRGRYKLQGPCEYKHGSRHKEAVMPGPHDSWRLLLRSPVCGGGGYSAGGLAPHARIALYERAMGFQGSADRSRDAAR